MDDTPNTMTDRANDLLGSLLARIHRDGGHYQSEHGTEKAVKDADIIIATANATLDKLPVTADGVRVVPGVDYVWAVDRTLALVTGVVSKRRYCNGFEACMRPIRECHSTREAAEAARKESL